MRWPAMNTIAVFEAVGRHESLLKAAAELGVTPGAVSRQIKRLEQSVGTELFARGHRKVTLTEDGRSYWTAVSGITKQLKFETEQLIRRKKLPELRVSCSITFLQHWMLPRFPSFQAAFPDLNVSFAISRSAEAFEPEFDCNIRIRHEPWPELRCDRLLPAPMAAICSPSYLASHGSIRSIDQLRDHTLLFTVSKEHHWLNWLGPEAERIIAAAKRVTLNGTAVTYQAVLNGLGIGLGRMCLVGDDLLSGRLQLLLQDHVAHGDSFYLVTRPKSTSRPEYKAFHDWIVCELTSYWEKVERALPCAASPDLAYEAS
jgi:LysR family transcriptional regulator, glycine cleavage system transcriptional activator